MRQDYSWVPWFRALATILANGRDWLAERVRSVDWSNDDPVILRHGAENVDPFSFLHYLASYAGEARRDSLLPVYESVHNVFDVGEKFPTAFEENKLVIPTPSTNFLFHDGESLSTEPLWNLFGHVAAVGSMSDDRINDDFADVLSIPNVSVSKLTETLFLIDPERFLPVDESTIGAMSRYLDVTFPKVENSIEQNGYVRYKEIVERIRRAFPGCHPYEIQSFLFHHGQQALVGSDPGVFQVSSNVFGKGEDLWSADTRGDGGGADGQRTFDEDHCVYVGSGGNKRKYPIVEPVRGDVILVRYKRHGCKAVGIVEKNGYKDEGGFHKDAAIHVFWINKTTVKVPENFPQIGFDHAKGKGTEKAFRNAEAYKISFDLFDKLRESPSEAPWADRPDLTEAALVEAYPDVLGPGKWDFEAAGGPPPGPREFWIAERFGFKGPQTSVRLMMAMFARKGLGAEPGHYTAVKGTGPSLNYFLKFYKGSALWKEEPPDGFDVRRQDRYYRAIWLHDDAVDDGISGGQSTNHSSQQNYIASKHQLNTILYGPPGTGKTYATARRCVDICEGAGDDQLEEEVRKRYDKLVDEERVEFVTFHQSYGYEEFVEGLRPDSEGREAGVGLRLVATDGVLKLIAKRARLRRDLPYVLVIDEINRANVSKVMGELVTLLEDDKREGAQNKIGVMLPHSHERFTLPQNLHILGTMNTADRSIALLDTALRRRFTFEELAPDPGKLSNVDGVDLPAVLRAINDRLEWLLDRDHLIGHAWFMSLRDRKDIDSVMRNKIIPLIAEYFYDDWTKVRAVLGGGSSFVQSKKLDLPPGIGDDAGEDRFRWKIREEFPDDAYVRLVSRSSAARLDDDE